MRSEDQVVHDMFKSLVKPSHTFLHLSDHQTYLTTFPCGILLDCRSFPDTMIILRDVKVLFAMQSILNHETIEFQFKILNKARLGMFKGD